MRGSAVPRANDAFAGVIASDTSAGGPTVSVAEPETEPTIAVMVVVPIALALDSPDALMLATAPEVELHVRTLVRSCVEPLVYVPIAVNCWVVPSGIAAAEGVIVSEISAGGLTVIAADPLALPDVAVIVAAPIPIPLADPELLISATDCVSELQVAEVVRSCVLPSV